ncbi:MAG: hypothetical protein AAF725_23180, partial [Acidobacteriota bacterium]
ATWATVASYLFLAAATCVLSQRVHPVAWEYGRLAKLLGVGSLVYAVGVWTSGAESLLAALTWQLFLVLGVFPLALLATGFLEPGERARIRQAVDKILGRGAHNPEEGETTCPD